MKLNNVTQLDLKETEVPIYEHSRRQKIALLTFFILILIYFFTLMTIRSIYGEPLSFFFNVNNNEISDNLFLTINSDEISDNASTLGKNIGNQFVLTPVTTLSPVLTITGINTIPTTSTPKPSTRPTTKPTTKSNTPTPVPTTVPNIDYSKPWEVSPGCPATTQNCVPCLVGESYCRVETGKVNGFKGWSCQNNNPGNIRPGASKNIMISNNGGTPPCGQRTGTGGTYMVFRTYEEGRNGLKAYLKGISNGQHSAYQELNPDGTIKIKCGECSLQFFFSKYAPSGDQNDPSSYANYVANRIGVSSSTTMLSWIVANKLDAFAEAIQTHEGWFTH